MSAAHPAFPVSVKGVVIDSCDRVLLLKNERDEWELPGGRVEIGESPEDCVAREIGEETTCEVVVCALLDTWMLHIPSVRRYVFVVTYGCRPRTEVEPTLSHEHRGVGLFTAAEVAQLPMPDGYRRSIATWRAHPARSIEPQVS